METPSGQNSVMMAGVILTIIGIVVITSASTRLGSWMIGAGVFMAVGGYFRRRDLINRAERERMASVDPWDPKDPVVFRGEYVDPSEEARKP